jgi:4-hydroxy-tetrahydrodipicolinate reductase
MVKLALQKKGFEIVGAVDVDPAKVGRDLGEVADVGRNLGVTVSRDAKSILTQSNADVVIHTTQSFLRDIRQQILEIAEAGLDIVSTSEELTFPFMKNLEIAEEIDEAAKRHGITILATGVNPGFLMDAFPLMVTSVCQDVKTVKVTRIMDASIRRLPFQKKIGAGMTKEQFRTAVATGRMGHIGLPESIAMISAGLGWTLSDIKQTIQPVIAKKAAKSRFVSVKKGQVAGLHQVGRGFVQGKEVITLDFWAYIGARENTDSTLIRGTPNIDLTIQGGVHGDLATAAMVINSIPRVINASPGLVTMKDLPIPSAIVGDARVFVRE